MTMTEEYENVEEVLAPDLRHESEDANSVNIINHGNEQKI